MAFFSEMCKHHLASKSHECELLCGKLSQHHKINSSHFVTYHSNRIAAMFRESVWLVFGCCLTSSFAKAISSRISVAGGGGLVSSTWWGCWFANCSGSGNDKWISEKYDVDCTHVLELMQENLDHLMRKVTLEIVITMDIISVTLWKCLFSSQFIYVLLLLKIENLFLS